MIKQALVTGPLSPVMVQTTSGRGFTVDEIADRCMERLMLVSRDAPPAIRDQAVAFKDSMRQAVVYFMAEAVKSDRTSIYNILMNNGQPEAANLILKEL